MANKTLQIAKERDGNVTKVLKFDLTPYSYLFNGCYVTKSDKSKLCTDIDVLSGLRETDCHYDVCNMDCVFVDFMSYIRSQNLNVYPSDPISNKLLDGHFNFPTTAIGQFYTWTFGKMLRELFADWSPCIKMQKYFS